MEKQSINLVVNQNNGGFWRHTFYNSLLKKKNFNMFSYVYNSRQIKNLFFKDQSLVKPFL